MNTPTSQANNVTTGRIYQSGYQPGRAGKTCLGKTMQSNSPRDRRDQKAHAPARPVRPCDIVLTELGGTVGDIESLPYVESVRQLRWELGREHSLVIHLTWYLT
ncbi:MAG: hypothetical protein R2778_01445 [Saprospiraceae bacterium]